MEGHEYKYNKYKYNKYLTIADYRTGNEKRKKERIKMAIVVENKLAVFTTILVRAMAGFCLLRSPGV